MREKHPLLALTIVILLTGSFLAYLTRSVWNVEASTAEDASAYAPIVLGEMEGPTVTPTIPVSSTPSPTPSATPTETPTITPTATPTNTPTSIPTETPRPTRTPRPTKTPKPTNTPKPTQTEVPDDTPTPEPTLTPTPAPPGEELLVFDLDRKVTKGDNGFPYGDADVTEAANFDWTEPVNYAEGTMYFRVEIYDQPVPKEMKLQLCFWQDGTQLESCGPTQLLTGDPGTVAEWSVEVTKMYKKNGIPIDWSQPRSRVRVAIKNKDNVPVSNIGDWNWGGDDPDEWYPLDMHFSAVVVEAGAGFSGWGNYP
ncbi:MAG: hypothetical protein R3C44_01765 [Chloroflexota bacterium]